MKIGDLVEIQMIERQNVAGLLATVPNAGVYLGIGSRGPTRKNDPSLLEFLWRGRITTFDKSYWQFRIISG
jgi:hypothetical protein